MPCEEHIQAHSALELSRATTLSAIRSAKWSINASTAGLVCSELVVVADLSSGLVGRWTASESSQQKRRRNSSAVTGRPFDSLRRFLGTASLSFICVPLIRLRTVQVSASSWHQGFPQPLSLHGSQAVVWKECQPQLFWRLHQHQDKSVSSLTETSQIETENEIQQT